MKPYRSLQFLPRLFCALGSVLFFALAPAQDKFDFHVADMAVLMAKPVQKEIGITEAQRAKMNVYAKQFDDLGNAYRAKLAKTHAQPDRQKVESLVINLKTHVFSQLTLSQLKRLREISLQHDGVSALADEVVAKRVGLNAIQLKKIRQILIGDQKRLLAMEEEAEKPIRAKYQSLNPKSRAEAQKIQEKAHQEIQEAASRYAPKIQNMLVGERSQIISVLNARQQSTWDSLLGKPFSR